MDTQREDNIVRDIITLDPELATREAEIRSIVAAFLSAKPETHIDGAFLNRLRARLVKPTPRTTSVPSPFAVWMLRLAPVGVAALLLIITVPTIIPREETVGLRPIPSELGSGPSRELSAPFAKRTAEETSEAGTTMLMQTETADITTSSFSLGPQLPGDSVVLDFASLVTPGFMVIHREQSGEPGLVAGVSALLLPGLTERITVPLASLSNVGETYLAILYTDDGDGVFDILRDTPVFDASGTLPLSVMFSVEQETPIVYPGY